MRNYIIFVFGALIVAGCNPNSQDPSPDNLVSLQGETMGTTLSVKYIDSLERDLSLPIDSILIRVNNSMSTYIPNSTISIFNRMDTAGRLKVDEHFYKVLRKSKEIFEETEGAFNPAIMPLVRYWGFADQDPPDQVDSSKVDSLLKITDFDRIHGIMAIDESDTSFYVEKESGNLQLDFSAIAKGYGVDVVGAYLESKQIANYLVEIGGELRCRGHYTEGKAWRVGVEDPKASQVTDRKANRIVSLKDASIATSGNYRNVREIEGKKYAHTMNPVTGYPEKNELLSVSIVSEDCMTADGYATACMVLGLDKARILVEGMPGLEGYFISAAGKDSLFVFNTTGFEEMILEE